VRCIKGHIPATTIASAGRESAFPPPPSVAGERFASLGGLGGTNLLGTKEVALWNRNSRLSPF